MKKVKSVIGRMLSVVAPMALALAVFTANSTCFIFSHQPDEPTGIEEYKLKRID